MKKIPIFSSNWRSEIGSKYANFSDFRALLSDPETTSLETTAGFMILQKAAPLRNDDHKVSRDEEARPVGSDHDAEGFPEGAEIFWKTRFIVIFAAKNKILVLLLFRQTYFSSTSQWLCRLGGGCLRC